MGRISILIAPMDIAVCIQIHPSIQIEDGVGEQGFVFLAIGGSFRGDTQVDPHGVVVGAPREITNITVGI